MFFASSSTSKNHMSIAHKPSTEIPFISSSSTRPAELERDQSLNITLNRGSEQFTSQEIRRGSIRHSFSQSTSQRSEHNTNRAIPYQASSSQVRPPEANPEETIESALSEYTVNFDVPSSTKVMTKSELKMLKKKRVKQSNSECAICHDQFALDEIIRILPCKHFFHYRCLKRWFHSSNNCPLCRLDVRQRLKEIKRANGESVSMAEGPEQDSLQNILAGLSEQESDQLSVDEPVFESVGQVGRNVRDGFQSPSNRSNFYD